VSAELNAYHHLILGLCVWLSYSADRFSEPSLPSSRSARRYEIFKNHKTTFLICWSLSLLFAICCSVKYLEINCILYGIPLFAISLGNFFLCRVETLFGFASPCTKEFRTAFILSLGCLFFPAYESSRAWGELSLCWILLFILFFINCISVSKWEWFKDEKRGSLSCLQKKPEFLKALAIGKYPFALIILIVILRNGAEPNLSMHVLSVTLFVISLDFFLLDEEDKRGVIDLGYWILPLTLLGAEYVCGI
jgi:hypothetical protein